MKRLVFCILCSFLLVGCAHGADGGSDRGGDAAKQSGSDLYPEFSALDCVDLGDYADLDVEMKERDVIDSDVLERAVDESLSDYISMHDWEVLDSGTVGNDDWVSLSFACTDKIGGERIGNACSDGMILSIADNPFGYGFYDELVGKDVGTEIVCERTYGSGDDVQADLADRTVEWKVKILGIKAIPDVSDESVRTVSEGKYPTVADYKEAKRKEISGLYGDTYERQLESRISDEIGKTCKVSKLPDGFAEFYRDHTRRVYEHNAKLEGMDFPEYLEHIGVSEDSISDVSDDEILASVSDFLIYLAIAEKEDFLLSDAERGEAFDEMADEYGFGSRDEMLSAYSEGYLSDVALCNALMQKMASDAKVTYTGK